MITAANFKDVLITLGFQAESTSGVFRKTFEDMFDTALIADFKKHELTYPEKLICHDKTTCNFAHPENFVVFECVVRLLEKGYRPEHIELEKRWNLGHDAKGGKADICVYDQDHKNMLMIIECKTFGSEYGKALKEVNQDGGQLFSYWQQERSTQWLALYASDFDDGQITYVNDIINCLDDQNLLELSKKDDTIRLYKDAYSVPELFEVWTETYTKAFYQGLIFGEDTVAYQVGVRPLRKKDLKDFAPGDKIVNRFEEILRHNNVSDKENAFNRLTALFICKLVDEIRKGDNDELEFQYKQGIDTYETLQDRLQRLHREGMKDFMKEEIFYVGNDYAENLVKQYSGQKRKAMIEELQKTIRILKFYTNNDFSFKDVHNEELFYQNGKVLVEVVQLFEHYRIVYPNKHQFLGDLFEQLLNKGFKQNEGQFFTPMPITRFVWDSLPLDKIIHNSDKYAYPKVIDFACGAGHFLTEAVEAINDYLKRHGFIEDNAWVEKRIFGIEKDYRLARVSKISLFMNGAGYGNIIFGDGLDNYPEKQIEAGSFDILVANPPYSVSAFKAHFKPKNNQFELIDRITNDGSEIEVLFVERLAQLLKPKGIAAVILPASILSNSSNSYIGARENLLENFNIRAIAQFGSKTFGATGTNTIILFLEKYDEPPKRKEMVKDSVSAILSQTELTDWEDKNILQEYLAKIQVSQEDYFRMFSRKESLESWKRHAYFGQYVSAYLNRAEVKTKLKQASFKKLSEMAQNTWLQEHFYQYIENCEKEKLYYFALIYRQKTLIITAPTGNDEQKEFLGYDWSNRKGAEGIQILTPGGKLYNDTERTAENTISNAVRKSFESVYSSVSDLEKYLAYYRLQDMIDFSRVEFYKEVKTAINKGLDIRSKYPSVMLGSIVTIEKGQAITKAEATEGNVKVVAGGVDFAYTTGKANRPAGIITVSASGANAGFVNYWDEPIFASDCTTLVAKTRIETLFIFHFLRKIQEHIYFLAHGAAQPHVYGSDLENIKIPLPPLSVQEQIVSECETVDAECKKAKTNVQIVRQEILDKFKNVNAQKKKEYKLSDSSIFNISIGRRVVDKDVQKNGKFAVYSANVFEPLGYIDKLLLTDFSQPSVTWGIDGDWMVNFIPANVNFYPTDHCGVIRIKTTDIEPEYFMFALEEAGKAARFSRTLRASTDRIKALTIQLPSIESQKNFVQFYRKSQKKIEEMKKIIVAAPTRKQAVLDKWL